MTWRLARASDLDDTKNAVGAPSLAPSAKGGKHERIGKRGRTDKYCVGSIATCPCKKRKDGPPSA
jgi:hypothetical protein